MPAPRFRLWQYPQSPFCIPIRLMLEHGQVPHIVENIGLADLPRLLSLTRGEVYEVPLLEDLTTGRFISESSPESSDLARYIAPFIPGLDFFPEKVRGLQEIIIRYIEDDCESVGFKICDAHGDQWLRGDIERGLHRRHKERKFGRGCLDLWRGQLPALVQEFLSRLAPFEEMLKQNPFLLGPDPVYADYALAGVIGNFLYPKGRTELPLEFIYLGAWYARMLRGEIPALLGQSAARTTEVGETRSNDFLSERFLADPSDVAEGIRTLNLGRNRKVLNVAGGTGAAGLFLAEKGLEVTLADAVYSSLERAAEAANAKGLFLHLQHHGPETLPYPDGSFDLVLCRHAAHRMVDGAAFTREASRVLRPYGHLLVLEPVIADDQPDAEVWMNEVERRRNPAHVRFTTPATWTRWATGASLRLIRSETTLLKMADLHLYLEQTATPEPQRREIRDLMVQCPASARELFRLTQEEGRLSFSWTRLLFLAAKI